MWIKVKKTHGRSIGLGSSVRSFEGVALSLLILSGIPNLGIISVSSAFASALASCFEFENASVYDQTVPLPFARRLFKEVQV